MKIITVLGTRPEIIKLSPLLPLLDQEFEQILIHTGQHYSWEMDALFFNELKLRKPDYNLEVGSGLHAEQTAKMIKELEKIMLAEKPEWVLVFGDTNSTLAGSLAAVKLPVKIAHIEAGARSRDKKQPEEINRVLADHCADLFLAIDEESANNLYQEGIAPEKVFIVGNLVEEACAAVVNQVQAKALLQKLNLTKNKFIVVTIHRAENTDNKINLENIISTLNKIAEMMPVIFPLHPRTKKCIEEYNLTLSPKIRKTGPFGYVQFANLLSQARFIITDSGGVQEEAFCFNIPVLIPRKKVELFEFVRLGKAILVGTDPPEILKWAQKLIKDDEELHRIRNIRYHPLPSPSSKIIQILKIMPT